LKGAEKRANTKPNMMKSIRLEQITCKVDTHRPGGHVNTSAEDARHPWLL
jgi:hypothetical protein